VIIFGFTLLVPQVTLLLVKAVAPLMRSLFGELGNLSARGVVTTFSRTGIAVTSLSVAIATTIGVAVMITSFRDSVENWLDNTLRADIFVRPAGEVGRASRGVLSYKWIDRFSSIDEVESISIGRTVQVQSSKGVTKLFVYQIPETQFDAFDIIEGNMNHAREAFFNKSAILISEPYSFRHDLHVGDQLSLTTEHGSKQFDIAGVYVDYADEQGVVTIFRKNYLRYWNDESISSLGIYTKPNVNIDKLISKLTKEVNQYLSNPEDGGIEQDLQIESNAAIKQASISVFDRTFAVTHVLRILAITVAFVGVLSALMSILIERSRELALLRAIGLTPQQVWWVVSGETGLIGIMAGLMAVPLGLVLASILIFIINRRSFGWTMDINVEPFVIVQSIVLAATAAIIAGIVPAMRMSRVEPAIALREE
jgi:putative ABC transport system permease protein